MKNLKIMGLCLFTTAFNVLAQEQTASINSNLTLLPTPISIQPLSLTVDDMQEVKSLTDDQLSAFVSSLNVTPTISFDALPRQGIGATYFSLQNPEWPPLPGDTAGVPVWQMDGFYLLNDLNHDYNPPLARHMRTSFSGPVSPGDGSDGGGTNTPNDNVSVLPSYGTNLWIAQVNIVSNNLTGIASNTLADVQYEIQTKTNLLQTNWLSTGSFILGSETTNWTPLNPLQVSLTNNLLVRLKSWASSDNSGLPDWWQLQYFGTNGVDPYCNPAGDGWSNLQKFQNGMNPNVFYTPAAPQGVTARLNSSNGTAKISWLPAAGSVTGYTVSDSDGNSFNVSASTTSFTDDISGDTQDLYNGGTYTTSYQVRANYAAGNSPWSGAVPLQSSVVNGTIIAGANGQYYLGISDVPTEVVTIRLIYTVTPDDYVSIYWFTNHDISISAFTNGYYPLPTGWLPPQSQGYTNYFAFVQGLDAGGNGGAATYIYATGSEETFHDGRIQLKQNVVFLLRSALKNYPFSIIPGRVSNGSFSKISAPQSTNYVYSSIWVPSFDEFDGNNNYVMEFDSSQPFRANTMFRNFIFDTGNLNSSGAINTGASGSFSGQNHIMTLTSPTYQFVTPITNWSTASAVLSNSQWLCSFPISDNNYNQIGISKTAPNYFLGNNISNVYGLPFVSTKVAYNGGSGVVTATFTPGGSTTHGSYFYPETAQPQFQTVEYDFWNPWYGTGHSDLPGAALFSPTNKSALFLVTPGHAMSVAGYAKLALQNGYTNRFAYLGQYFDKAYKIGTNGIATTNTTGFLTPYGDFFATEPGPIGLVTMPDVDTGASGTCTVYSVSISVDANHDGIMDLSFNGADVTSSSQPFTFWINNNHDRPLYDSADGTNYEDDLNSIDVAKLPYYYQQVPDYNFLDITGHRCISSKRDLEDFTRLWVNGVTSNLLVALPSGSTVTLSWGDVGSPNAANPTIDLFQAADADGGIGYLTNSTSAGTQTNSSLAPYIGRLGPGNSIALTATNLLDGHFIWCGVAKGAGQLFLTIADATGNVLAQSKVNMQIKDIKNMYERWTVGDEPNRAPYQIATYADNDLPSPTQRVFQFGAPEDTNTSYILFVHGWNMRTDDKDHFAETAFKRLYWQGYQGRFGSFRWPTYFGFTDDYWKVLTDPRNYDNSEFNAWQSAQGLTNLLTFLNIVYPGHVYMLAHSMGNVVAGEALRLAAQNGSGQIVNTYVASQAALSAHTYDATVTTPYLLPFTYKYPSGALSLLGTNSYGPYAPDIYVNRLTNNVAAAGKRISFYNVNDFALAMPRWGFGSILRPDHPIGGHYYYSGSNSDPAPWNHFEFLFDDAAPPLGFDIVNSLTDRYTVLAYAAPSYSTALGATPGITNWFNLDMTDPGNHIWPSPDPFGKSYASHFWHSAQFRGDASWEWNYWQSLLHSSLNGFNINSP